MDWQRDSPSGIVGLGGHHRPRRRDAELGQWCPLRNAGRQLGGRGLKLMMSRPSGARLRRPGGPRYGPRSEAGRWASRALLSCVGQRPTLRRKRKFLERGAETVVARSGPSVRMRKRAALAQQAEACPTFAVCLTWWRRRFRLRRFSTLRYGFQTATGNRDSYPSEEGWR